MSLGNRIKENRAKLNITQEELGKQLHVSRQTVSNWEVGRSYPDIDSLILLSDLFNISLDNLLREDKKMTATLSKNLKKTKVFKIISMVLLILVIGFGIYAYTINKINEPYREQYRNYIQNQPQEDNSSSN